MLDYDFISIISLCLMYTSSIFSSLLGRPQDMCYLKVNKTTKTVLQIFLLLYCDEVSMSWEGLANMCDWNFLVLSKTMHILPKANSRGKSSVWRWFLPAKKANLFLRVNVPLFLSGFCLVVVLHCTIIGATIHWGHIITNSLTDKHIFDLSYRNTEFQ